MAQILIYASSIDAAPSESLGVGLEDHYDPNLIDRNRLLALTHLLRSDLERLPPGAAGHRLLSVLDEMDRELRRRRPRWRTVIASAFVLLSVLANLKTVAPNLYESAFRTASAIISLLQTPSPAPPHAPALPPLSGGDYVALPPEAPEPRKPDDR